MFPYILLKDQKSKQSINIKFLGEQIKLKCINFYSNYSQKIFFKCVFKLSYQCFEFIFSSWEQKPITTISKLISKCLTIMYADNKNIMFAHNNNYT